MLSGTSNEIKLPIRLDPFTFSRIDYCQRDNEAENVANKSFDINIVIDVVVVGARIGFAAFERFHSNV